MNNRHTALIDKFLLTSQIAVFVYTFPESHLLLMANFCLQLALHPQAPGRRVHQAQRMTLPSGSPVRAAPAAPGTGSTERRTPFPPSPWVLQLPFPLDVVRCSS